MALFGFIAVLMTVHYFVDERLEKIEKRHQMEEEARQIGKSNSGL